MFAPRGLATFVCVFPALDLLDVICKILLANVHVSRKALHEGPGLQII